MSTNAGSIRRLLALGVTAALALVAAAAVAVQAGAAPSNAQKTIRSGAGPGWPKTLHPSDFVARVDNPWFPLRRGSTWVYRGVKDGEPARDVVVVTSRTRTIQAAPCVAVADRLYLSGRLEERTTDWYSQDSRGNRPPRPCHEPRGIVQVRQERRQAGSSVPRPPKGWPDRPPGVPEGARGGSLQDPRHQRAREEPLCLEPPRG
ncbi:MAG: hypothetical protein E6G49_04510 [Actinobacteria bacterium]|nr:MAG: hypothetical protein E6G49_04510 [Actinomycetota bacterium]